MPTLDEMVTWTVEEIETNIGSTLPQGWTVEYNTTSQAFTCHVKDETGAVVKMGAQPDKRVLLLDIYGWLYARSNMSRVPTMWNRRQDPRLRPVVGKRTVPGAVETPDPDDLDPKAVRDLIQKKD